MDKEKILKAGQISVEVKKYARTIVKKGVPLLEIAEKLDAKILELGGKPAFPINLSINQIAAHYTPTHNDEKVAHGLIKVDLGVHIDGWIADTAFSIDLEGTEENKKLIEAATEALNAATKITKLGISTNEIGAAVEEQIKSRGFLPIINLFGHGIERYKVHSGITIPNIDDGRKEILGEGQYAIEPFATSGKGKVHDGPGSNIYIMIGERNVRSPLAREILKFIKEEYKTIPFCSRWIVKKFGARAMLGLRELERNGNLHHFAQLIEVSKKNVAQAEDSILIEKNKVTVTTE